MILHRLVEHEIEVAEGRRAGARGDRRERLRAGARSTRGDDEFRDPRRRDRDVGRAQHRGAGRAARVADLRRSAHAYAKLVDQLGPPPFTVRSGRSESRRRSTSCATRVLDAAKQGMQVSRFKGLGEMNAEQLWETTMDPGEAPADARRRGGRGRSGPGVLDADGRRGRAAAHVHRRERHEREVPRVCLSWRPGR